MKIQFVVHKRTRIYHNYDRFRTELRDQERDPRTCGTYCRRCDVQLDLQSVITDNTFACVSYMTAGLTHDPVENTKEGYMIKIVYQDSDANTVSNLSDKFTTIAGFNAGATAILANTALSTAHGGTPVRDHPGIHWGCGPFPAEADPAWHEGGHGHGD